MDADLLARAREAHRGSSDAATIDAALRSRLARHRGAEIDAGYTVPDEHPLDQPDEWGDLASPSPAEPGRSKLTRAWSSTGR